MEWLYGLHVLEHVELAIVAVLFFGCLGALYFIQRWISGDEYYR